MTPRETLERRERLRFQLVELLYEKCHGSPRCALELVEIAEALRVDFDEVRLQVEYLVQKGTIKYQGHDAIALTAHGVDEYSRAVKKGSEGTETFPMVVIHGNVGAFQHGANATAHVVQNVGAPAKDVLDLIAELRAVVHELPEDRRAAATRAVKVLAREAESNAPDKDVVELAGAEVERAFSGLDKFQKHLEIISMVVARLAMFVGTGT